MSKLDNQIRLSEQRAKEADRLGTNGLSDLDRLLIKKSVLDHKFHEFDLEIESLKRALGPISESHISEAQRLIADIHDRVNRLLEIQVNLFRIAGE